MVSHSGFSEGAGVKGEGKVFVLNGKLFSLIKYKSKKTTPRNNNN